MKAFVRETEYCEHCHLSFPLGVYPSKEGLERFNKKLHPHPWVCVQMYEVWAKRRSNPHVPAA